MTKSGVSGIGVGQQAAADRRVILAAELRRLVEENCTEQELEAARLVFEDGLTIPRAARRLGVEPGILRGRLDSIRVRAVKSGLQPSATRRSTGSHSGYTSVKSGWARSSRRRSRRS